MFTDTNAHARWEEGRVYACALVYLNMFFQSSVSVCGVIKRYFQQSRFGAVNGVTSPGLVPVLCCRFAVFLCSPPALFPADFRSERRFSRKGPMPKKVCPNFN